jgi:hypothetical protein
MPRSLLLALALSAVAVLLALPLSAGAIVPPKDCGKMTLSGKRYQVKADQITCSAGRKYVKGRLVHHRTPKGYKCSLYPAQKNRVRLSCSKGVKTFFAIRR